MKLAMALALVVLVGCSTPSRDTAAPAAHRDRPAELTDQAAPEADSGDATATGEVAPEDPAAAAPGPDAVSEAYPDIEPGETHNIWGEMFLEMELEPACATVGTPMRAVIRTVPDALIGGAVKYSDGAPHDDLTFGRAPTGEWVWTWTIKPTVPKGQAEAFVTAGKSGESGGAVRAAFLVADRC